MEKQFPVSELRSYEKIYNDVFSKTPYKMAILKDNDEIVGYVTYFEKNFIWIDYLAIIGDNKSKGFGSLILKKLFEYYKNKSGAYFEVELENPDEPLTTKRIEFYKNVGCKILDFKYFYPNENSILQMNLMYKALSENEPNDIIGDIKSTFDTIFVCEAKEEAFNNILNANNIISI